MIPETWLPTLTVVTADSAPVAVTVCVMSPLSTAAVRYFASGFPRLPTRKKTPTAAAATTRIHATLFWPITYYKTPCRPWFFPLPAALGTPVTASLPQRLHGQGRAGDFRENRIELFEAVADQEIPRPAVALGPDQVEARL